MPSGREREVCHQRDMAHHSITINMLYMLPHLLTQNTFNPVACVEKKKDEFLGVVILSPPPPPSPIMKYIGTRYYRLSSAG